MWEVFGVWEKVFTLVGVLCKGDEKKIKQKKKRIYFAPSLLQKMGTQC